MDEMTKADRLNQHWDALLDEEQERLDLIDARTLLLLHNLDETPGPRPEFADRLWAELSETWPIRIERPLWRRPLLSVAASLAVILIATAFYSVLRYTDVEPNEQFSVVATSTPSSTRGETPGTAVPTTTPHDEPAGAPPTATATATQSGATATVDPNATVPTGPPVPVQLGGGPVYETLEQMVNASNVIVVGHLTDEVVTVSDGLSVREVSIERALRGALPEHVYIVDPVERQGNGPFVMFLTRINIGPDASFSTIGMLPIADSSIVGPKDGFGLPVHLAYSGQPVNVLAADIEAIPDIDLLAESLLRKYGWTPVGKQSLWPRMLPERDAFERSLILPFMRHSFESTLESSQRVGLDFSSLAGQDVQILVYLVEREPTEPMERAIRAGFVIYEQSIVGAWIVVDETERPYGLDERDAVLEVPVFVPTPEPTPTIAIPTGETINPAQFYRLAETDTFTFCWPYCDEEPKTVGLRNAIIAAFDQELTIRPLDVRPTPTQEYPPAQSDGSFVHIVFGFLTPGWNAFSFGYDRDAQLVLLPHNAGWVAAPSDLIEIMAGIEPPPLPTK